MKNVTYVKDGDNISIIVKLDPSVHDPVLIHPEIAMVYRVVATSYGPTLELVPLGPQPVFPTESPASGVSKDGGIDVSDKGTKEFLDQVDSALKETRSQRDSFAHQLVALWDILAKHDLAPATRLADWQRNFQL